MPVAVRRPSLPPEPSSDKVYEEDTLDEEG